MEIVQREGSVTQFVARAGERIRNEPGPGTIYWDGAIIHEDYESTVDQQASETPDVALLLLDDDVPGPLPALLPRQFKRGPARRPAAGNIGISGLVGPQDLRSRITDVQGRHSIRSASVHTDDFDGINTGMLLHYNLLTEGGTSGSPVFDHNGYIVGINHAETAIRVRDLNGDLVRIGTSHQFGIHVEALWQTIDQVGEAPSVAARVAVPDRPYQPYLPDWNGETAVP